MILPEKQNIATDNQDPVTPQSAATTTRENFLFLLGKTNKILPKHQESIGSCNFIFEQELNTEILSFSELINIQENRTRSTNNFWEKYAEKLPKLFKLFLMLHNITSTSASVERFFSIAGLVCYKRRLMMKEDLIEYRSMLKANMSVLDSLC